MTPRPIINDHNVSTSEVTSREMNDAEFAQYEKDMAEGAARKSARDATEAQFVKDLADGTAKLEALGLTVGQAKAVVRKDK